MDPSGSYDPTNADEGDMRDPAQQALDRTGASGDTSNEGLLGEPSGTGAGATGVVGQPSGTGAGASGVAGSSAGNTWNDPAQQGIAGTGDLASAASSQGIDPSGYDTTNQGLGSQAADPSRGGQSGMNDDPNQNYDPNQGNQGGMRDDPDQGGMRGDPNDDPNQGGMRGQGGMNDDLNQQGMGGMSNDPDQGGMRGQGSQGYDPNQGMSGQGGMSNDPNQQGMGGQQGYNDPDRQSDQSYNDPSSNS